MSVGTQLERIQTKSAPQGRAIGIVDTAAQCVEIVQALKDAGFADLSVTLLSGIDGIRQFRGMLSGSLLGDLAEDILKHVVCELERGHFVFMVVVEDRDEALITAHIAARIGGHSIYHFGQHSFFRLSR